MKAQVLKGKQGRITAKCAFSQGKPTDPFGLLSKVSKCQVCGGRGEVTVLAPAIKCAFCHGSGVHRDQRLPCVVCSGKGIVNIKEPIDTCPDCEGRGVVEGDYLPCLKCKGKGAITKK